MDVMSASIATRFDGPISNIQLLPFPINAAPADIRPRRSTRGFYFLSVTSQVEVTQRHNMVSEVGFFIINVQGISRTDLCVKLQAV